MTGAAWTQPICRACYSIVQPDREPVSVMFSDEEKCCMCGTKTIGGIYYRIDPSTVPFPSEDSDE